MHSALEIEREAKQALADAIEFTGQNDGFSRRIAIEAIEAGRAAFWSRASYHSTLHCEFLDNANRIGVTRALSEVGEFHRRLNGDASYINSLVPLNELAWDEVSRAKSGV